MLIGTYYVHRVTHHRNIPDVPDEVLVHLRPSEGNNTAPPLQVLQWEGENVPAPGALVRLIASVVPGT